MQATITTTGETITGKTIKDIRGKLNAMLSVDGPRGLTAVADNGTEIHVELYEGQDYIRRVAAELGRRGGSVKSAAKAKSSAANGKAGGRPSKQKSAAKLPEGVSAEQAARDMLERAGVECAQSMTAGDLVEIANLIAGK